MQSVKKNLGRRRDSVCEAGNHSRPNDFPSRRTMAQDLTIERELIALVGEVVEVEGLGIGEVEDDFGAGGLPGGAEAAEFARF